MENASKALLIAAAVLVVILLIAFGMQIFQSAGTSSGDAQTVGNAITSQTGDAKNATMEAMGYKWVEDADTTKEGKQPGWVKE